MTLGQLLGPQAMRQFIIDDLVERLTKLGVDWSDITDTDSADPTSVIQPTNDEIRKVREFLNIKTPAFRQSWIIQDWAGNRLFPHHQFNSFEEGWSFVRDHSPEADWQDIYVMKGLI